ncbi:MAG: Hsp33 family molecular chaperone HslO [Planctomycetes bacterium]|jgi:redox-regulated HSP33 family molecular chaperone|nr:Hsp33 family molecular chaperone HslO [Planctomycetota bacterium]HPY74717.1 Hsp33 family molecular chaperone HslO [Planctomycetota bacterium]HQA99724.1 Hsp33 family molecular chaperone HslO [Planctomycetota bacterium]
MKKQEYLRKRDRLVSILTDDGKYRISLIKNTTTAQTAQKQHNLDYMSVQYWAKAASCAIFSSSLLKGEERVTVYIKPETTYTTILAEAMHTGEVRGYVQLEDNVTVDQIPKTLKPGIFRIDKVLYGKYEPMTGIIKLQEGDITSDYQYFLTQSDQIASYVWLYTETDEQGQIILSTALLIQAMPGTTQEEINELASTINFTTLPQLIDSSNPQSILEQLFPQKHSITNNTLLDFYCRCSHKNFKSKLLTFTQEEIKDMQEQNQREMICHYCNKEYVLTDEDFQDILLQIQKQ